MDQMDEAIKPKKRKKWIIVLAAALAVCIGLGGYHLYSKRQMDRIQTMTLQEMIAYTTKNNSDAVITVGIVRNGEMVYDVYGKNGSKLPPAEHIYEIGSITKTFTASLLCKAVSEGRARLDDPIDLYLDIEKLGSSTTIGRLATHTSGCKATYFETPMIKNFLQGQNSFAGITKEMLRKRIGKVDFYDADAPFVYSNFGFAVLGAALEHIYDEDYVPLMNAYIAEDLGLAHTRVSNGVGDLSGYWKWQESDAYIPAGALLSTIGDMMQYLVLHMSDTPGYLSIAHGALAQVDATTENYAKMGIRIDAVGVGWMIDCENGIIWHNGATSHFNCYIGFDKERQIGVAVLSNLPPNDRIPATVMGVELLTSLQAQESLRE
jgi:CubicO group peptidase (beta-lactamase class C family)